MSISVKATEAGLSVSVSTGDYFGNRDEDVLSWNAIAERLRPLLADQAASSDQEHVAPADLNLSGWIERRAKGIGPYHDHITKGVKAYEAEILALREKAQALVNWEIDRIEAEIGRECRDSDLPIECRRLMAVLGNGQEGKA